MRALAGGSCYLRQRHFRYITGGEAQGVHRLARIEVYNILKIAALKVVASVQSQTAHQHIGDAISDYLKEHHRVLYYNLLTSCKLEEHLAEVEQRATLLEETLVSTRLHLHHRQNRGKECFYPHLTARASLGVNHLRQHDLLRRVPQIVHLPNPSHRAATMRVQK